MLERQIQAQEAADLLASEAWKRAYARARSNLFTQWEAATTPDDRERVWHLLKALDLVKATLAGEASSVAVDKMTAQAKG